MKFATFAICRNLPQFEPQLMMTKTSNPFSQCILLVMYVHCNNISPLFGGLLVAGNERHLSLRVHRHLLCLVMELVIHFACQFIEYDVAANKSINQPRLTGPRNTPQSIKNSVQPRCKLRISDHFRVEISTNSLF